MKLEVAGTGYEAGFDWDDPVAKLEPVGPHACCGSAERCWTCADNEELARIMATALRPFVDLRAPERA